MLSRVAEALFWVGRYVERAEDTARLLDVHFHEVLEDPGVDDARAEYTKSLTKINAKSNGEVIDPRSTVEETYYSAPDDASFVQWLKRGFAFTLPLLILGLSALLVFYFMHG